MRSFYEDVQRLRRLADEPERMAMPRTVGVPTPGSELNRRNAEIRRLRLGLREAIAIIDTLARGGGDAA